MKMKQVWAIAVLLSAISFSTQVGHARVEVSDGETRTISAETITGENVTVNGGGIVGTSKTEKITITGNSVISDNTTTQLGGGIYSRSELAVENATLSGNTAKTGGGIYHWSAKDLTIKGNEQGQAVFKNNKATGAQGGGVYASTKANIENALFEGNTSKGDGGAFFVSGGTGLTVSTIKNSTFKNNESNDWGGAIGTIQGNIVSTDNIFESNSAQNGGAVSLAYANKNASFEDTGSTFKNNEAKASGGAIANMSTGGVTLTNSQFISNKVTGATTEGGGAIFIGGTKTKTNIDNVLFDSNTASNGNGGAIATRASGCTNCELNITNSTFKSNEANIGGAIFNTIKGATIDNTVLTNNSSTGDGGAIYNQGDLDIISSEISGNKSSDYAGAIFNGENGTLDITGSTIKNNEAVCAGAIYAGLKGGDVNISNSVIEGNKASDIGAVGSFSQTGTMTIDNTVFKNNEATGIGGGNDGGGALFVGSESTTVVKNSTFDGNSSASVGGAIATRDITKGNNVNGKLDIENTTFTNNTAKGDGGAIYNAFYNSTTVPDNVSFKNVTFDGNSSDARGGALYNAAADLGGNSSSTYVENAKFVNNSSTGDGGAIYNQGDLDVISSEISGNKSSDYAGAIFNGENGTLDITGSTIKNNEAVCAGAIYAGYKGGDVNISNSVIEGNKASDIGAVGSFSKTGTMTIDNTVFKNNEATGIGGGNDGGGALFVGSESTTVVKNSTFDGNSSASVGGAIATRDITKGNNEDGKLDIENTTFTNNTAKGDGGAIYNAFYNSTENSGFVSVKGSTFDGNKSSGNGGAIYNAAADLGGQEASVAVEDTSFTNNSATGNGGAIYSNGAVKISANNSDVVFSGNSAADGGDIYMAAANSILNINANSEKTVTFASGISGNDAGYDIEMTGGGTLDIQSAIKNANITVDNSTLHLNTGSDVSGAQSIKLTNNSSLNTINNQLDSFESVNISTDGTDVTVSADVNMSTGIGDNIGSALSGTNSGVIIDKINAIGNTTDNNVTVDLYKALGLSKETTTISGIADNAVSDVMTPIRRLTGSISEDGILNYGPTGNSYHDFNSAVMVAPVASLIGGYLNQLQSYDEAFRNMDMYMLMTKDQRQALKYANKYAAADSDLVYSPTNTPYADAAGWFRPFGTFERVGLHHGPKVSNVAWGTYAGLESELYDLGNNWDGMFSIYAGYNGSHQAYQGNSIYQNGGTLGVVGMAYKGNFFTGLTANVGSNLADADTKYGNEDFAMLMTGVASKSGYNFEFKDGKFIVQPSFMMAYSMVNTFDYTNSAGVRIDSNALHAFTFEPGLKFIGNLNNGWQPYAGVSVVMNALNDASFKANDTSLPELSVKPYAKYGVGVRKTWGERFTGFLQAFVTSGGRNGVGFQGGFRWSLGKKQTTTSNEPAVKKYVNTGSKTNPIS